MQNSRHGPPDEDQRESPARPDAVEDCSRARLHYHVGQLERHDDVTIVLVAHAEFLADYRRKDGERLAVDVIQNRHQEQEEGDPPLEFGTFACVGNNRGGSGHAVHPNRMYYDSVVFFSLSRVCKECALKPWRPRRGAGLRPRRRSGVPHRPEPRCSAARSPARPPPGGSPWAAAPCRRPRRRRRC